MTKVMAARAQGRALLRDRILTEAQQNSAIVAIWFFGSEARGDADGLSDIDVWLVVEDSQIDAVVEKRFETVAQVADPLLILDFPHHAPVGGGYLMVQYDAALLDPAAVGPLQVDWYWQPRSEAAIPNDAKVMLDRVGLAAAPDKQSSDFCYRSQNLHPPQPEPTTLGEQLTQKVSYFWSVALISAKLMARKKEAEKRWVNLGAVEQKLNQVRAILGHDNLTETPSWGLWGHWAEDLSPQEQLVHLRKFCSEMEVHHGEIQLKGGIVPNAVIRPAQHYFEMIQQVLKEG